MPLVKYDESGAYNRAAGSAVREVLFEGFDARFYFAEPARQHDLQPFAERRRGENRNDLFSGKLELRALSRAASNGHRAGRVDSGSQNGDQPVQEGLLVMNCCVARGAKLAQFVGAF